MFNNAIRLLFLAVTAWSVAGEVYPVPGFTVLATIFQLSGFEAVDNIKLYWNAVENAIVYQVLRSTNPDFNFTKIANTSGNTFDDYGLQMGKPSYYQVKAYNTNNKLLALAETYATPYHQPETYLTYDNTVHSALSIKSNLKSGGIYYRYLYTNDANGFLDFKQQTSGDGLNFTGNKSVLNRTSVCASIKGKHCKLESMSIVHNPVTGNFTLWAHLENIRDYTIAQVAVAEAVPGKQFTFLGTYRPLGYQSRDLTFFSDTDGSGYLISSTNGDSDMNLFKLNKNWNKIDSLVTTLLINQHREAPAMVRIGDWYYLFTSDTAGWYPSQGLYISSNNLAGPWSELREPGNTATFGAQSGGIVSFGNKYVMMANNWLNGSQLMLPITFNDGYATYGFYPTVKYNAVSGQVIPVQSGKIVSIGKPSYTWIKFYGGSCFPNSINSEALSVPSQADNGNMADPRNGFFVPSAPFNWEIDLQNLATIGQIDITFPMVKGSEAAYSYRISASPDGVHYQTIIDNTNNTSVGFISSKIESTQQSQYVRIDVFEVINVHNNHSISFDIGLIGILIYDK